MSQNLHLTIVLGCLALVTACSSAATPAPTPAPSPLPPTATIVPAPTQALRPFTAVKIRSEALAQNLIGDRAERTLLVYLPPSYFASTRHYPVVYYLPGFGDSEMIGFALPDDMNTLIAQAKTSEMIIVIADGTNRAGGSFYVNSPVTGNWEDYIVQDVVGYIDSHYRTLAEPQRRGLSGHSMGGFGALYIGMRHPDLFGAVFSLSPGLFDQNGLAESQMFASPLAIDVFLKGWRETAAMSADQAKGAVFYKLDAFTTAYGLAFASDPSKLPFQFDYPYTSINGNAQRDDAIWTRWQAGFGGIAAALPKYGANLKQLRGLVMDYGRQDAYAWIPKGCEYLDTQLTAAGIPHTLTSFDGGHQDQLGVRIREQMLPFFSQMLSAE